MDLSHDEYTDVQTFASRAWIHRHGFGPGTEAVRAEVADTLTRRVDEVVVEVLAAVAEEGEDYESVTPGARRVLDGLAEYTREGTLLTAEWIRTGAASNRHDYQRHRMDHLDGFLPAGVTGRIIRMIRSNLAFGDGCKRILYEEVRRAGAPTSSYGHSPPGLTPASVAT